MKGWQFAALLGVLVIGLAVVFRRSKTASAPATTKPSTSNDMFASLLALGISAINSKPQSPSAIPPNEGTYRPNASTFEISGNQLVNPATGNAVVYGTD